MGSISTKAILSEDEGLGSEMQSRSNPWRPVASNKPAFRAHRAPPKISVVDDEQDLHTFLQDLGGLGHFQLTSACYSAAEALKRVPEERPDAVIMDIRLPDMSGIDCTTKLKTVLPGLAVIMLTGYPDGRVFFRSLMAGA